MDCQNIVSTSAYDLYKLVNGPCNECLTEEACRTAATAAGLKKGGNCWPFASSSSWFSSVYSKGCYAYNSG